MVCEAKIKKFIKILSKKKIKLCIAESITGGSFAYKIIKNEGASKIIDYSIVCYSNNSKREILNIKEIAKYGVVSKEVAKAMAKEVVRYSDSKKILALSCTGQAGPKKLNQKETIGSVYIGVNYNEVNFSIKRKIQEKKRLAIIDATVNEMIDIGLKTILR